jgi:high-affinity nickel-transport protein
MAAPLNIVLLSCGLLGFRHGFDYDHIAAITDIAGVQRRSADTMRLGLMYALGHAATVALLGGLVIGLHLALPVSMDRWAEQFVGITLIVLAVYVLYTLIRRGGREMPKSRAVLLIGATRWIHRRVHGWITGQKHPSSDAVTTMNSPVCFGIGVIHGLGAETPSQLALFLLASNLGGVGRGFLGLSAFLIGLLVMNTVMTASASGLFTAGLRWAGWYPILAGITAVYSFCIGIVFLLGYSGSLHKISG